MNRGVQTYNQWALVMERWVESPPTGYLQTIPVWVQLRNIPVNYKTFRSIKDLGGFAGQVLEVAYDPLKAQSREYVRVRVKLDVSNPVRRTKVVNLPSGEQVTVRYDFERLQKRCYTCQRLTHEQEKCPLFLNKTKNSLAVLSSSEVPPSLKELFLKREDPLFGILKEDQVGLDPSTGRHRIAPEVLEGMRIYLLAESGLDMTIKALRVKNSVEELKNDPRGHSILTLEPNPIITSDLDKGKGIVFGYEKKEQLKLDEGRLMKDAIISGRDNARLLPFVEGQTETELGGHKVQENLLPCGSTGYRMGFFEPSSSGIERKKKKNKPRKRPHMSNRKPKGKMDSLKVNMEEKKKGLLVGSKDKRKAKEEAGDKEKEAHKHKQYKGMEEDAGQNIAINSIQEMVPSEGLSNF